MNKKFNMNEYPCGMICGHDYDEFHPGVIKAVDEIFSMAVNNKGSVWWTKG